MLLTAAAAVFWLSIRTRIKTNETIAVCPENEYFDYPLEQGLRHYR